MRRRPADTGDVQETVELKSDFKRAFGEEKTVLVGLAISSDRDDTGASVRAQLDGLRLE
ncbi:DUF3047 domain-containing protein [Aliiruegeria lutimaris]|uniref:DUF3047 domain-containing protein n=1 Tax=Aliiruegeria lutimaris TaxID=571298 RepID=UPI000B8A5EE5